jgi:hypothetical protein
MPKSFVDCRRHFRNRIREGLPVIRENRQLIRRTVSHGSYNHLDGYKIEIAKKARKTKASSENAQRQAEQSPYASPGKPKLVHNHEAARDSSQRLRQNDHRPLHPQLVMNGAYIGIRSRVFEGDAKPRDSW